MFNLLRKAVRAVRGQKVTAIESLFGGIEINKFTDFESYLRAGTKKVWATWKACDLVAKAVADTPMAVYRKNGTEPVRMADLDRLLTVPNEDDTFADLLIKSVFHVKLTGNAYWLKDEATLKGDRPRSLINLNPKRVQVQLDGDGRKLGYILHVRGLEIPLDLEEVMHFRQPHPDNDYYGLGDIEAAEPLLNDNINRGTWAEGFWKNGASPSGILVCEDVVTDQQKWEQAKAKWQKEYGGSKNSGKTAWLTGKWRYEQLGMSAQEMQNIEQSKMNVESIFLLHGVPLSVAGIRDAANYATADIDDQRFRAYTVKPLVKLFQDTINSDLVAGWGESLELRFNVTGLVNIGAVVTPYSALFDRGIISINEFRERVGMQRIEDPLYDQHFITAALVPLDLAGIADQTRTEEAAAQIVNRQIATLLDAPRASKN